MFVFLLTSYLLPLTSHFLTSYFADEVGDIAPGMVTEICPPQLHIHLQLSNNTGKLEIFTCPPGAHGAAITGIQGMGVSTPIAADVAEATVGLASDWHMPKGAILTIGLLSMILPIAMFINLGRVGSIIDKVDGANPNVHCKSAP